MVKECYSDKVTQTKFYQWTWYEYKASEKCSLNAFMKLCLELNRAFFILIQIHYLNTQNLAQKTSPRFIKLINRNKKTYDVQHILYFSGSVMRI